MADKKRLPELSLLNVIFCLLVVFIHIISYAVASFEHGTLNYNLAMFPWRSFSFVVQGFIFISGIKLFLSGKNDMPYINYLKSRFKAIIIPYIICFAVYYLFYILVYDYPFDIAFITKQFLTGNLVCHLYFIPLMVQFDLLKPLWNKIVNNASPVIVVPFLFMFSQIFEIYFPDMLKIIFPDFAFPYNDRIFTTYLALYISGCYIGKNYQKFTDAVRSSSKTILICFIMIFVLFIYYTFLAFNDIKYIPFMNQIHSLYVISVIILLFMLSLRYSEVITERINLIKKIDTASYSIYLWHMLILFGANKVIEILNITSQLPSFAIRIIIVYSTVILLSLLKNRFRQIRR